MSDHKPEKTVKPPKAFGWMAEYADENQLLDAARQVRDSGYTRTDAFTPFPVHGIDEALGIKPTVLPWFTLLAGGTGTIVALTMQWWMNAVDYPYIISGKPFASWPAFIPVAFELTVLFAAFTTVFAMLGLNGLPRFSNPLFNNPKFDRTTDDRFFLWVDSSDKYFNSEKVRGLLDATSPVSVDEVREDESSDKIPRPLIIAIFTMILATLIPAAIVLNIRAAKSGSARWHVFFDMDFQPKKKPQTTTSLFADNRVQRPPVPGTIARGELDLTDPFYLGYDGDATASLADSSGLRLVGFQQDGQAPASEEAPSGDSTPPAADATPSAGATPPGDAAPSADDAAPAAADAAPPATPAAGELKYNWLTEFPLPVDEKLFALGKAKFEQNCSLCHGFSGYGDGLVARRAAELAQGYWLPPTSMHDAAVQKQPIGQIYYTITNGKGKMGGYGASLNPKERWAVVLYVRALQRSQNANEGDVPPGAAVNTQAAATFAP